MSTKRFIKSVTATSARTEVVLPWTRRRVAAADHCARYTKDAQTRLSLRRMIQDQANLSACA